MTRVMVQNDFSDSFITKEGLRQGNTLVLNVALEGTGIQTYSNLVTNLSQILAFAGKFQYPEVSIRVGGDPQGEIKRRVVITNIVQLQSVEQIDDI